MNDGKALCDQLHAMNAAFRAELVRLEGEAKRQRAVAASFAAPCEIYDMLIEETSRLRSTVSQSQSQIEYHGLWG